MDNGWVARLPTVVFTRIMNEFSDKLKKKYKMTRNNFSTVGSSNTPAVFPFVFVQLLPSPEQGRDLEATSINAGLFTFQIDVTDNKSQTRVSEIAFAIMNVMKNIGFEVISIPNFENTNNVYRSTARYRRCMGWNDIL